MTAPTWTTCSARSLGCTVATVLPRCWRPGASTHGTTWRRGAGATSAWRCRAVRRGRPDWTRSRIRPSCWPSADPSRRRTSRPWRSWGSAVPPATVARWPPGWPTRSPGSGSRSCPAVRSGSTRPRTARRWPPRERPWSCSGAVTMSTTPGRTRSPEGCSIGSSRPGERWSANRSRPPSRGPIVCWRATGSSLPWRTRWSWSRAARGPGR